VLELVRSFQAVETELGVAQTPIEVAMDDWALATVADLEDRTRVRGVAGALVPAGPTRRRRRRVDGQYSSVGTVVRDSIGQRSSTVRPPVNPRLRALVWGLVVAGVLALALGATAVIVLLNANGGIPVVSDISASVTGTSIKFSWQNPGLGPQDQYQISTTDSDSSVQQANSFVVDATKGEHVCITVTVNREGQLGSPSSPKCVDVDG
jgi:hypothetical protein